MKKISVFSLIFLLQLIACNTEPRTEPSTLSSNSSNTMQREEREARNKKAILSAFAGFNEHSVEGTFKYSATADHIDYANDSEVPLKGIDTMKVILQKMFSDAPDIKYQVFEIISDSNVVMTYGQLTGTPKNDKPFKTNYVHIFKFNEDGKIVEHRGIEVPMSSVKK